MEILRELSSWSWNESLLSVRFVWIFFISSPKLENLRAFRGLELTHLLKMIVLYSNVFLSGIRVFFGGPYNLSSHTREAEVSILHFKR